MGDNLYVMRVMNSGSVGLIYRTRRSLPTGAIALLSGHEPLERCFWSGPSRITGDWMTWTLRGSF